MEMTNETIARIDNLDKNRPTVEKFDDLGDIDLVFASEYFEHFERPVEHLIEVVEKLNPKYILFANTFNSKSIGHFDIYKHLDKDYSGPEMSKLFTKTLKSYKFKKVNTNCFNNRPNFYKR
jgi:2-polyprenyl-3-methyl-5-hydroxy-6-metoxy-1,4-benzoquinol methylase